MYRCIHRLIVVMLLVGFGAHGVCADSKFNIAIIQHQKFLPFDQAHAGFTDSLISFGYENKIMIVDDYNALSDIKALEDKIRALSQNKTIDLIFSIGTHSTTRLVNTVYDIPIIFTIVGDPEQAGIVTDWKTSGRNYTGVETPQYYSKVIQLMHNFVHFKSLGMVYLKGSPSHEAGIVQIEKLSKELGFRFVSEGFPLRNQKNVPFPREKIRENLNEALKKVCPNVGAFFVQTSNTFTSEFDLLHQAFLKHKIISAGDPTNISNGLVMGIGKDARRFGRQCAQYAIKILEGTPPAQLPMDVGTKLTIDVNLKAAEMIGFTPPFELISAADNVFREVAP